VTLPVIYGIFSVNFMPAVTKSNVGKEPLRWNLDAMSREFNFSIPHLRGVLAKHNAVAGEDGCFSTQQIVDALYGALHLEKIRTQRAMTERITLENQITRAEVLNRADLAQGLAGIADAMCSIISTSGLSRQEQDNLRRELASIPIILVDVAKQQSRLRRAKNGAKEAQDEDS
jgi:hypothetical protein